MSENNNKKNKGLSIIASVVIFIFVIVFELIDFFADAFTNNGKSLSISFVGIAISIFVVFTIASIVLSIIKKKKNPEAKKNDGFDSDSGFRLDKPLHDEKKEDLFYHEDICDMDMEKCPKCNTPMPKANLYCDSCGFMLRRECFYCGHINKKESTVCEKCGSKL